MAVLWAPPCSSALGGAEATVSKAECAAVLRVGRTEFLVTAAPPAELPVECEARSAA